MLIALSFSFQVTFQIAEARLPEPSVSLDPAGHPLERHRVEAIDTLPSRALVNHQPRPAKYAYMLGNCGPTQLEVRRQCTRAGWPGAQAVEDSPPSWVGDGSENVGVGASAVHDA
jgi:hypothetical protein